LAEEAESKSVGREGLPALIVQLLDKLEIVQAPGGKILDWHTCDIFPERWIDLVVVLRCDHSLLWTRLEKRRVRLS
jgi:adenylate kinase